MVSHFREKPQPDCIHRWFCGPGKYKGGEPGSPLVALDVAINHQKILGGALVFLFIDADRERIEHLRSEINGKTIPSHYKINTECGKFNEIIEPILSQFSSGSSVNAPIFAFVDPFGFSGIPYSTITQFLNLPRSEILITFMADSINRWIKHQDPKVVNHIIDFFGTEEAVKIAEQTDLKSRVTRLKELYQKQLQKAAKYVRYFGMSDHNNRTKYYLFFATNHPLGHLKMKEAMWKVDQNGEFMFSDATNPNQLVLFENDCTTQVRDMLIDKFKGCKNIPCTQIIDFINDKTPFLAKHMRTALKHMEQNKQIMVADKKADGSKRRANSFPDKVIISFCEERCEER